MKIQEKLEQKYEQCKKEDPKNMERAEKFVSFMAFITGLSLFNLFFLSKEERDEMTNTKYYNL